jgi:hypothetical protein
MSDIELTKQEQLDLLVKQAHLFNELGYQSFQQLYEYWKEPLQLGYVENMFGIIEDCYRAMWDITCYQMCFVNDNKPGQDYHRKEYNEFIKKYQLEGKK